MPKFLTVFYYNDIGYQHLYKDVGSIPLALSRYCGWKTTFAYVPRHEELQDDFFEKHVNLIPIKSYCWRFLSVAIFLWEHAASYEVINLYHLGIKSCCLLAIIRARNSKAKIYIKLDINKDKVKKILKMGESWWGKRLFCILNHFHLNADIYSVETKMFASVLNRLPLFHGRLKYLPNGFWQESESMISNACFSKNGKRVILSVGRIGAYEKNSELLIEGFATLPIVIRQNWMLILVGTYTKEVFEKVQSLQQEDPELKGKIILTGRIDDKKF